MIEVLIDKNRLKFIDSLRGLAALYVLAFHMVLVPETKLIVPPWLKPFLLNGGTGVTLFFIISAFTLCYTLQFQKAETNYKTNFYIRRILRIVPLYYAWLIFVVIFQIGESIEFHGLYHRRVELFIASFFGYNFVPGKQEGIVWASWTLGVEMIFYLFFPFIFKLVTSLPKALIFLLFALLLSFAHYEVIKYLFGNKLPQHNEYIIHVSIFNQLPVFAIGIIAYYLYVHLKANPVYNQAIGLFILAAGFIYYFALYYFLEPFIPKQLVLNLVSVAYLLIFLGLALIPLKLFINKITNFYGTISYSLYLNHPVIVYKLNKLYVYLYSFHYNTTLTLFACFIITVSIVTIVSLITFKLIESPGIAYGKRLIKKLKEKKLVSLAKIA
jgi:peptidoglycan/LPS O-acetylase OafA/YrhL